MAYYHKDRTHLGLGKNPPIERPVSDRKAAASGESMMSDQLWPPGTLAFCIASPRVWTSRMERPGCFFRTRSEILKR